MSLCASAAGNAREHCGIPRSPLRRRSARSGRDNRVGCRRKTTERPRAIGRRLPRLGRISSHDDAGLTVGGRGRARSRAENGWQGGLRVSGFKVCELHDGMSKSQQWIPGSAKGERPRTADRRSGRTDSAGPEVIEAWQGPADGLGRLSEGPVHFRATDETRMKHGSIIRV